MPSLLSGLLRLNRRSSRGVNTTGRAQMKPALEMEVLATPKVAPAYTPTSSVPMMALYFSVARLICRSFFQKMGASTRKASRKRKAFRFMGCSSDRHRSTR